MCDKGYIYLFDMLGEVVLIFVDVYKYFKDYLMVIEVVGCDKYGLEISFVLLVLIKFLVLYFCY